MKKRTKRIIWIIIIIAAIALAAVAFLRSNTTVPTYSSLVVETTSFVQSVEETGVVDTEVSITYGWETSGRVVEVGTDVGDMVTTSQIIAKLDDKSEVNALRQVEAQLQAANARLREALAGPTDATKQTYLARIAQAEASKAQAETALSNTRISVAATIADAERAIAQAENTLQQTDTISQAVQDAYDDLGNAISAALPGLRDALTATDNILGVDNTVVNDDFENVLGAESSMTLTLANRQYPIARDAIVQIETSSQSNTNIISESEASVLVSDMNAALDAVSELLIRTADLLDMTPAIGNMSQTQLDTFKTSISTQKTSIATANTTLTNNEQAVTTAENSSVSAEITLANATAALETAHRVGDQQIASAERTVEIRIAGLSEAQASYDALVAPPRSVDVAAFRADVSRVSAQVSAARTAVDDMVLRALAEGTITLLDVSVGETVSPNQNIVTIQSDDRKIEVDISESDIAKVAVGDTATVELDAYDDLMFDAAVTKIDPAATEISGVVYYKTTLSVSVPDTVDVRPGMTADVQIITEERPDSIVVPRRAVLSRADGTRYVRVLTNAELATFDEVDVTVGLSGDEGTLEILSGLTSGSEVITFIE